MADILTLFALWVALSIPTAILIGKVIRWADSGEWEG